MTEQLLSPSWGKGGNGTEPPTVNEHLYKVLIVGDFGVGEAYIALSSNVLLLSGFHDARRILLKFRSVWEAVQLSVPTLTQCFTV